MELTKEQILQIDNYISACGIKYYDVKAEIIDHFASILELRLEEEPDLDFKSTIVKEHKKFSDNGFKKLLKEKTNSVNKKFYKSTTKHLKSFFKLPKIIITVGLFFLLYQVMYLFENKKIFFLTLALVGFLAMLQLGVRIFIRFKQKKEQFLTLNRTDIFLQVANFIFIMFSNSINFRSEKSYLNNDYNIIHLAVFVLVVLVYWSMEHVYQQNRKQVVEQYPNVIV